MLDTLIYFGLGVKMVQYLGTDNEVVHSGIDPEPIFEYVLSVEVLIVKKLQGLNLLCIVHYLLTDSFDALRLIAIQFKIVIGQLES